ncbi:MAG: nicotinate-nucleotide adenylyltransferase [Candidatus Desulfofervidus auxilii]|nr:nicotinate-nucleotide adenylyltransferase [Candidatus Desulfofervidus auxilii]
MKLGIFGGTFNPIHVGHLRAAEEVREKLNLDKILFIPASIPPHRPLTELVDFSHRYEMVKKAIANNPYFFVSDIEGKRAGKSYTVDTLEILISEKKDIEMFFIIGLDAFLGIKTWKTPEKLFQLTHFIVIPRKAPKKYMIETLNYFFSKIKIEKNCFYLPTGKIVYYCPISSLNISATHIRRLIREKKSIRYLVPSSVEEYIYAYGLYRGRNEKCD